VGPCATMARPNGELSKGEVPTPHERFRFVLRGLCMGRLESYQFGDKPRLAGIPSVLQGAS
jgi:hypothetical protein